MKAKLYTHSDKSDMYYKLATLGLPDELAWKVRYALYEVEFEVDIDETTGEYIIERVTEGKQILIPQKESKENYQMNVRAKWHCSAMKKYHTTTWVNGKPVLGFLYSYEFHVVVGDTEENQKFYASTPSGKIEISSVRDDFFEVGADYYTDFSKAE